MNDHTVAVSNLIHESTTWCICNPIVYPISGWLCDGTYIYWLYGHCWWTGFEWPSYCYLFKCFLFGPKWSALCHCYVPWNFSVQKWNHCFPSSRTSTGVEFSHNDCSNCGVWIWEVNFFYLSMYAVLYVCQILFIYSIMPLILEFILDVLY